MKLIGRTRDQLSPANHGEATDWVKFFNEDDVYLMIGTVHTVLAQPKHGDDETKDSVDGQQ